jgi:hypothetical protein
MPRPPSARSTSVYQKYFDAKSLKNVASCAAIIFIIVHLVDYLWNYTLPLRLLNFITLSICLLITFLFVVNELGRLEEKIILGWLMRHFFFSRSLALIPRSPVTHF